MKTLLIFPPQWTPLSPHYSLTSISAQLKAQNYDVKVKDWNIDFYNDILTKGTLLNAIKNIDNNFQKAVEVVKKEYSPNKKQNEYSSAFHQNLYKMTKIKDFKEKYSSIIQVLPDKIEAQVNALKSKESFYDSKTFIESLNMINIALELVSLRYLPTELSFSDNYNRFLELTYKSIKENCDNSETNIFYHYFRDKIKTEDFEDYDLITVSVNSTSQIIPCFTLARMLKQKFKAKVAIGGNFIARVIDAFAKHPEMFDEFFDYVSYAEGEKPTVELVEFIDNKRNIEDVSNLIYKKDNRVIVNKQCVPLGLDETIVQNLDDYKSEDYFVPEIVLPIFANRGCYWGKCSFCDQSYGQQPSVKSVDKLIEEIKYFNEKYKISNFEFIDEAMSAQYMKQFSTKIIENNLNISWFVNARLERTFTKEILELAQKAGLKMLLWGLESGSTKVMRDINKGIDIDSRLDILRTSQAAGIWNFAFIFFGFPTETAEDAQLTIDMIRNNTDVIASYGRSVYTMGAHSKILDSPQKYGITNVYKDSQEFSPTYYYETNIGMNSSEVSKIAQSCTEQCRESYGNPLWMYLCYREVLFLYIKHHGADTVQQTKIKTDLDCSPADF